MMSKFLTHEKFLEKVANLKNDYWSNSGKYRWQYMNIAIQEAKAINPSRILEIGTNNIALNSDSYQADINLENIDQENRNQAFIFDCSKTPWSIPDKYFDIVIGLQVMEHFAKNQHKVFAEIRRIAEFAILSFPYNWICPEDPIHHKINDDIIAKWSDTKTPYKSEIIDTPASRQRIINFYKF